MQKHILIILTSTTSMGDTNQPTGLWAEELTTPYYALVDAGAKVTLASTQGGKVPFDPSSLQPKGKNEASVERFLADNELQKKVEVTSRLDDIDSTRFDAIFFPGGHGTMWDLPNSLAVKNAVEYANIHNQWIGAVCHGVAGLVSAQNPDGTPLVKGKKVNSFTNSEEIAAGLQKVVPFMLETRLREQGGIFVHADNWQPFVVKDGYLITGQNPQSSELVAKALLEAIKY